MSTGIKIREFAENRYKRGRGAISDLASALDMTPSSLQQYLSDRRAPGTPLLKKLLRMGCDLNWLLSDDTDCAIPVSRDFDLMERRDELRNQIAEMGTVLEKMSRELERPLKF